MCSDLNDLDKKARTQKKLDKRLDWIDDRRLIFPGHHSDHLMVFCSDGRWCCDCQLYRLAGDCPHVRALCLQRIQPAPAHPAPSGWPHTAAPQRMYSNKPARRAPARRRRIINL